ncbi:unnamed protein product [Pleuronectes platessa]|uniref:Uncharacterized protein n=1 Tax=Pleuronectes platessa TaxID=8262 RepID=A0A9N7TZW7_PLEPL|nr:unnamed protein product [Pleuronectes platessa]
MAICYDNGCPGGGSGWMDGAVLISKWQTSVTLSGGVLRLGVAVLKSTLPHAVRKKHLSGNVASVSGALRGDKNDVPPSQPNAEVSSRVPSSLQHLLWLSCICLMAQLLLKSAANLEFGLSVLSPSPTCVYAGSLGLANIVPLSSAVDQSVPAGPDMNFRRCSGQHQSSSGTSPVTLPVHPLHLGSLIALLLVGTFVEQRGLNNLQLHIITKKQIVVDSPFACTL